jgi:hypothetical protein
MIWLTVLGGMSVLLLLRYGLRAGRRPSASDEGTTHFCGASNPARAKYCRRCGEALTMALVNETGWG